MSDRIDHAAVAQGCIVAALGAVTAGPAGAGAPSRAPASPLEAALTAWVKGAEA